VLAFLEAGGPGYQSPFGGKVDKQSVIVPLGTCGYGLVTSGLAVEGDPEYKTVVLRLNEKLEVIGLWRWNISASYPDVETLDGDLILLSSTVEPNPWGDSNVVYHVVRVDGNTGVIKWRTDIDLPNHGASELAILPDNRIVLKGGIKGEWADPSINLYPLFSVLSPDGCVLAHVLYKDQLTSDGVPVMIATHLVALSNTLLADGDGPRVTFFNLPPTP
jgi:hypothetical protein